MSQGLYLAAFVVSLTALPAIAQQTRISEGRATLDVTLSGQMVTVSRNGAACPPACIQPMMAAPGVATIGELEVLDFLDLFVADGRGLLIDARLPAGYGVGTLPGAVNVPSATLAPDNPYRADLLSALGVRDGDFSGAYDLVLFADGPAAPEVPVALRSLLEAGYPAEKLKYYRGGYQTWTALGLSTAAGQ
ncbi:MAG: rhodanese-like domain-containing protein [Paracoccaceae bacterium]|nr:rhodanese-like domain-containing protein [Paracoccaceae bacterium]